MQSHWAPNDYPARTLRALPLLARVLKSAMRALLSSALWVGASAFAAPGMFDASAVADLAKCGMEIGMFGMSYSLYKKRVTLVETWDEVRASSRRLRPDKTRTRMPLGEPNRRHLERCFTRRPTPRRRSAGPTMALSDLLDPNVALGAGLLLGGTALGAGVIAFVEGQGEKTVERGALSDETKSRMSGMFMEDEVLVTGLDDTITKMEAALAKAEGRDVIEGDGLTEEEREKLTDKAWGDD